MRPLPKIRRRPEGDLVRVSLLLVLVAVTTSLAAQQPPAAQPSASSTALTIYNEDFAVARAPIDLDLHPGVNEVTTSQVTTQLEPDSVVLRDPTARHAFHIAEQNYDAGVVSQQWMLQKYEGKTINFQAGTYRTSDSAPPTPVIIQGKIIRAPHGTSFNGSWNGASMPDNQPLIEVNGEMQFQLPGTPLFPASTDGLLLKPTLRWQIVSDAAQKFSAELAYITGGLSWNATYNVVAPGTGAAAEEEKVDLIGWVTIHNQSGTEFPAARIKLMAGDVAKLPPPGQARDRMVMGAVSAGIAAQQPQVTQKAFDDFHLYDLNRTVSLLDGETKQVQFLEASGITMARSYLYDGSTFEQLNNFNNGFVNQQPHWGLANPNTKVEVVEEIKNSQANHLGVPLPAGRIRLYRRDSDGQMEFVGESTINHTPAEDTVKITTGSAFDIKGSRRQTDFHVDQNNHDLDETFEIKVTNQKPQPVKVTVLEHLIRGDNWEIRQKSADYNKVDSHTIEFPLDVPAKGEATLTYAVRYTW